MKHNLLQVSDLHTIKTEGNLTTLGITAIQINEDGESTLQPTEFLIELETLQLVQTFNTTWTNNAIGKLRTWINQLSK